MEHAPGVWELLRGILIGTRTYDEALTRLGPLSLLVDLVSDLLRASPALQRVFRIEDAAPSERFLRRTGLDRVPGCVGEGASQRGDLPARPWDVALADGRQPAGPRLPRPARSRGF